MKFNKNSNEILESIISANDKGEVEYLMSLLLIGSESVSIDKISRLFDVPREEIIKSLNKFNIHYASI